MSNQNLNINEEEWREKLTPEEFDILRNRGTEAPFSGKYVNSKDDGIYICKACQNPLFKSDEKFESSTGWPSFTQPINEGSVTYKEDLSHDMKRTEVMCGKCGSHLGHLFMDGPKEQVENIKAKPTGKRYCINSICLGLDKN